MLQAKNGSGALQWDGGVGETARTEAGGVWLGLRLGFEAAAKIAISLRLCLEPHLKLENIFCAPPYGKRIMEPSGNSIQQDSK